MKSIRALLLATTLCASPVHAEGLNAEALIVSLLLGDSAESLFPEGQYTPEAERKAILDLYADLKAKAEAPGDIDESAIVRFAVIGWLAENRKDSELATKFAADLAALVAKQTDAVFGAIAQTPFLVPSACAALARPFPDTPEGRAGRESAFLGFEPSARQMLGPVDAARCTLAYFGKTS